MQTTWRSGKLRPSTNSAAQAEHRNDVRCQSVSAFFRQQWWPTKRVNPIAFDFQRSRRNVMRYPLQLISVSSACVTTFLLGLSARTPAYAAEPSALNAAMDYIRCAKTKLQEGDEVTQDGAAGFGVVINEESYYFMLRERVRFSFNLADDALPVAHLLVDRPASENFDEQREWRERFMQDVAKRADSKLQRLDPAAGLSVFTVNTKNLKGPFVGLSLVTDTSRRVMVQWNWDMTRRYASPSDVSALQAAVWKALGPCLAQKR